MLVQLLFFNTLARKVGLIMDEIPLLLVFSTFLFHLANVLRISFKVAQNVPQICE